MNEKFLFSSPEGGPLSNAAMAAVIDRMNEDREARGMPRWTDPKQNCRDVVPHGFRSSFRDWAGEATNFPRETAEAALAHEIKGKSEAAYARGPMLEKRRKMMDARAAYCERGQNVLQLKRADRC